MTELRRKRREPGYKNPYGQAKIKASEQDNMSGFTYLAISLALLSTIYLVFSFYKVDLSILGLIKIICFFIGASFLIPVKLYRKRLTMSYYEYLIFNIIAISPFLTASTLLANDIFSSQSYKESYEIESFYNRRAVLYYNLKDGKYADKEYLRSVSKSENAEINGSDSLSIYFRDGLFGIRVIDKKKLH